MTKKRRKREQSKTGERALRKICSVPDRDVPALVCGHPLPCPHHTTIVSFPGLIVRAK